MLLNPKKSTIFIFLFIVEMMSFCHNLHSIVNEICKTDETDKIEKKEIWNHLTRLIVVKRSESFVTDIGHRGGGTRSM
jgi:hypothetical protein